VRGAARYFMPLPTRLSGQGISTFVDC
jgi:hypothetical protein